MQKFFDEVCEPQEAWNRWRYTEIAMEKKAAGGKEFTYDDLKRKVQIRRKSYERNRLLIESLIEELFWSTFFVTFVTNIFGNLAIISGLCPDPPSQGAGRQALLPSACLG